MWHFHINLSNYWKNLICFFSSFIQEYNENHMEACLIAFLFSFFLYNSAFSWELVIYILDFTMTYDVSHLAFFVNCLATKNGNLIQFLIIVTERPLNLPLFYNIFKKFVIEQAMSLFILSLLFSFKLNFLKY